MMDNTQFTEDQRAEAYRVESMQQLIRQTKALESIRSTLVFFVIVVICSVLISVLLGLALRSS